MQAERIDRGRVMDLDDLKDKWQNQKGDENLLEVKSKLLLQQAKTNVSNYESFVVFLIKFYAITILITLFMIIIVEANISGKIEVPRGIIIQIPWIIFMSYFYYIIKLKKYANDNYSFIKASIKKIKGDWIIRTFGLGYFLYLITKTNPIKFWEVANTTQITFYLSILLLIISFGYPIYIYLSMMRPTLKQLSQLKKYYEENEIEGKISNPIL